MEYIRKNSLVIKWDLAKEAFSLGGLLILRKEIEMLGNFNSIKLGVTGAVSKNETNLIKAVFSPSVIIEPFFQKEWDWPERQVLNAAGYSYQSFDRIKVFYKKKLQKPVLKWSENEYFEAGQFLKKYRGRCYTAHLKRQGGCALEESNANLPVWLAFFKNRAQPGKKNFILLGGDIISDEILRVPGVVSAENEGLSLNGQLAAISLSSGFLGMSSGICQGAIFSDIPFVIFKHPKHHVAAMTRDLDAAHGFSFFNNRQKMLRAVDSYTQLEDAFRFINL